MIQECHQYRQNAQPQPDVDPDAKRWERFIDIAQSNIKLSKQCLAPLAETAEYWGMDKVQYYEWASMGWKYCKVLGDCASQNPVWEEALVKLNQLLFRRIAEGRSLRMSANPVNLIDLKHLEAWPGKTDFERRGRKTYVLKYESVEESELPSGYAFDQFGLIASTDVACTKIGTKTRDLLYDKADTTVGNPCNSIDLSHSAGVPNRWLCRSRIPQLEALIWCLLMLS